MSRILDFTDGFTSASAPSGVGVTSSSLETYVDDAAFVAANGTAADGDIYYNTTDDKVRCYINGAWLEIANHASGTGINAADIHDGTVSNTEFGYLNGVTSAIQTQLNTKTDTGTSNEITLTGTTIGLADNPVVPGTDSMVIPSGTTAQRVSTTAGAIRYNSDLTRFEGYKSGAWSEIGGGAGGGLDSFYTETFEINDETSFTTGQNAAPDAVGTGTIGGVLDIEESTPISDSKSLKFTMNATAASSDNDFFINDTDISIDEKQTNNYMAVSFYYSYTGASGDIKFIALDQDDVVLTSSLDTLDASSGVATRFATSFYIPDGTTGLRYGFQVVTGNSSKVLLVDDLELSTNPFVTKNLLESQSAKYSAFAGVGSTATKIYYCSTEDYNEGNTGILTIDYNDTTNGMSITANRDCHISVTWSGNCSGALWLGLSRNASSVTTNVNSLASSERMAIEYGNAANHGFCVTYSGKLSAGDIVRPHVGATLISAGDPSAMNIHAIAEVEHVATPAKSSYVYVRGEGNGGGTISPGDPYDFTEVVDTHGAWDGSVYTVQSDNAVIAISASIYVTAAVTGQAMTLEKNGAEHVKLDFSTSSEQKWEGTYVTYPGEYAKGDTLNISFTTSRTLSNDTSRHWINIIESPGAQFMAAVPVERVALIRTSASSFSASTAATTGYKTATLNSITGDSDFISISSNQFTLSPGKYVIRATSGAQAANLSTTMQLYDITNSASIQEFPDVIYSNTGSFIHYTTVPFKAIEILSTTTFEIQTKSSAASGSEFWGPIEVRKLK